MYMHVQKKLNTVKYIRVTIFCYQKHSKYLYTLPCFQFYYIFNGFFKRVIKFDIIQIKKMKSIKVLKTLTLLHIVNRSEFLSNICICTSCTSIPMKCNINYNY